MQGFTESDDIVILVVGKFTEMVVDIINQRFKANTLRGTTTSKSHKTHYPSNHKTNNLAVHSLLTWTVPVKG